MPLTCLLLSLACSLHSTCLLVTLVQGYGDVCFWHASDMLVAHLVLQLAVFDMHLTRVCSFLSLHVLICNRHACCMHFDMLVAHSCPSSFFSMPLTCLLLALACSLPSLLALPPSIACAPQQLWLFKACRGVRVLLSLLGGALHLTWLLAMAVLSGFRSRCTGGDRTSGLSRTSLTGSGGMVSILSWKLQSGLQSS